MSEGLTESQTYSQMLAQVEDLVRSVQKGDLDLDALVARVEEGLTLLQRLRSRLSATEKRLVEVQRIYTTADEDPAPDTSL